MADSDNDPNILYTRALPGGGYVVIEEIDGDGDVFRARLAVERRTDPERRDGHVRPIIAEAQGPDRNGVYDELVSIAANNVAIAQGILRWQVHRRRSAS